jgi:uncharacterized protein with NAD-binding domain and iron-sulfur cluster
MVLDQGGEKVVILGGGFGSLCAAYELSDPAEPKGYDITLYQLGWRLGGKGASGRDHDRNDRIEEHGIHAFFGFYDNAFDIMQRCYGELAREPSQPLPTWRKAFEEHGLVVLMEQVEGESVPWALDFPRKPGTPGMLAQKEERPSKWELLRLLVDFIRKNMPGHTERSSLDLPPWVDPVLSEHAGEGTHPNLGTRLVAAAHHLVQAMHEDPAQHLAEQHHQVSGLLGLVSSWLEAEHEADPNAGHTFRHIRLLVDFFIANVRGILADGLLFHSVTKINPLSYSDWLRSHGASDFLLGSAILRGYHDLVFAYPGGDDRQGGNLEAGTALNLLLLAMGWKGSLMWKMCSGMGDVIFAPLYEVLKRRGVKFRFFHRVTGLHLDADGQRIERVTLSQQVNLEHEPDYHPLVDVPVGDGMLPCWPDRPRYEQIVEREALEREREKNGERIDLESFWTAWTDRGPKLTLSADHDFAKLILGIPVGAHPFLCAELIDAKDAWRAMVAGLRTVQTQSLQLWFRLSFEQLGWKEGSPIVGAYDVTPMNSMADTTQVRDTEGWPPCTVGSIAYLCGPMLGPEVVPAPGDRDFPGKSLDDVRRTAIDFLENHVKPFWPNAVADPSTGRGFRYELLVGGDLASQFIRANIDPSERYVQSFADTGRFRMRTDGSGCPNLILAGDWIDNGINIGCIEATAISGRQAARAISGRQMYIPHETPY